MNKKVSNYARIYLNQLKKIRAESGLSLRELSKASNVDQSTISRIENDVQKAQLRTLGRLANVFSKVLGRPVDIEIFEEIVVNTAVERGRKGGSPSHKLMKAPAESDADISISK